VTQPEPGAGNSGQLLNFLFAAVGVLTSLSLGVGMLVLGIPTVDTDNQTPLVSIEETEAGLGANAALKDPTATFDPKQANLVAAEDERLFAIVGRLAGKVAPFEVPIGTAPATVVLPARPTPYDLPALINIHAAVPQPDGTVLLQRSVLVGPSAQLHINAPGGTLRMTSGPQGFTSIVSFKGSIALEGAPGRPLTVTSWDPTKNAPDTDPTDGRSYLRSIGGRMDLNAVMATNLGFWSGRTGGVAWTGGAADIATGSARDSSFIGNHYGIFTSRSKGLLINGGEVRGSAMDGISVHRLSEGTQIWKVTTANNGRNGVAVARGSHQISIREVTASGNARNGVYLDGTPLADGPNASGVSPAPVGGFVIDGSTARGNAEHGILVARAQSAELTHNSVEANKDGVVVRGNTQGVALRDNRISAPGGFGVAIRDRSRDAVVERNTVTDALIAVQVDNSVVKITGNEIDQVTMHAVSIKGTSGGSSVVDNRLSGQGPSAIDLIRIAFGATVDISGNDDHNWVLERDEAQYTANFVRKHPLILLWALILVFPLAARVYSRHGRNRVVVPHNPYQKTRSASVVSAEPLIEPPDEAPVDPPTTAVPTQSRRLASADALPSVDRDTLAPTLLDPNPVPTFRTAPKTQPGVPMTAPAQADARNGKHPELPGPSPNGTRVTVVSEG